MRFAIAGAAIVSVLSLQVLGGIDDILVPFSTEGPDMYADGTPAKEGETYALVWMKRDGEFKGLRDDFTAIDPENRVVLRALLCRRDPESGSMHCPDILFQVDRRLADSLGEGFYGVVLCDTRDARGNQTGTHVNSTKLISTESTGAGNASFPKSSLMPSMLKLSFLPEGSPLGGYAGSEVEVPRITSFSVGPDGEISIGCTRLSPVCTWKVLKSESPGKGFSPDKMSSRSGDSSFRTVSCSKTALFRIDGERNLPVD